jgi:hypothetical protein
MRLGVMQPYFFPYLGHFALIAQTDAWVVFDVTQYTPKTWISRNRVLHPQQGWNWVSVPLRNGSIHVRIHEARVLDLDATRRSVLGKLSHYRRSAPHYHAVTRIVEDAFDLPPGSDALTDLNVRALSAVCRHLEIPFEPRVCSRLDLQLPAAMPAGDWALEISSRLGATAYLNPASGRALFDPSRFAERGIDLRFVDVAPLRYDTRGYGFEPHLSIVDVLMWNDVATVRRALRQATIDTATPALA